MYAFIKDERFMSYDLYQLNISKILFTKER